MRPVPDGPASRLCAALGWFRNSRRRRDPGSLSVTVLLILTTLQQNGRTPKHDFPVLAALTAHAAPAGEIVTSRN